MKENIWNSIELVRKSSPLVHNITNFVVMNNTANAILAVGASPIMAHAHSEIKEMVNLCQASVINIGTLDEYWVQSMIKAAEEAFKTNKPWVLDPVGAGATAFRNEAVEKLLNFKPTVIRGNASEIMALAKYNKTKTKGVDSTNESNEAIDAALALHQEYGSIVCISGETDIIVSSEKIYYVHNGNKLMTYVTGLGCSASAVIGAFIACIDDKTLATLAATTLFSLSGELAAKELKGPGSLQVSLLDKLYNITKEKVMNHTKVELKK